MLNSAVCNAFDILGLVPSLDCDLDKVKGAATIAASQLQEYTNKTLPLHYEGKKYVYTIPKVNGAVELISQLIMDGNLGYALTDVDSEYESHWNPFAEDPEDVLLPIPSWRESWGETCAELNKLQDEDTYELMSYWRKQCKDKGDALDCRMGQLRAAERTIDELDRQIEAFAHKEWKAMDNAKSQIASLEKSLKTAQEGPADRQAKGLVADSTKFLLVKMLQEARLKCNLVHDEMEAYLCQSEQDKETELVRMKKGTKSKRLRSGEPEEEGRKSSRQKRRVDYHLK